MKADQAAAPIPIRAQVGSPDGVTKASITPLTRSTTASPSATPAAVRPAAATARPRGSGPGSITVQPKRRPTPAATHTQVSSSRPCGVIRPKKRSSRPAEAIRPPTRAMLNAFCQSR